MPSVISGDANVSATEFGFLDGVTSALQTQIDSKLPLAGGKILQIVRATDSTRRSTTSTSYVDANISVTITPQKSDSAILLINSCYIEAASGNACLLTITDNSNNVQSGGEYGGIYSSSGINQSTIIMIAHSTPATTSAVTYKLRFVVNTPGTATIYNDLQTGQMYAIEVSA